MKSTISAFGGMLLLAACLSTPAVQAEDAPHRTVGATIDDSVITTKIKADLVGDPITKAHQIHVKTHKGMVQLSGFVSTSEAKERAGKIAADVEGVTKVDNDLRLRGKSTSMGEAIDDGVIKTKLKTDLIEDPVTKARHIETEVRQGVVELSGFVDSNDEKARAGEIAMKVKGVKTVHNDLEVKH
jgi:hyperosmotically inducible periplasmic protein